jgi:hypothetical protein
MLATLEKIDTKQDAPHDDKTIDGHGAFELKIPTSVQSSLDEILNYYKSASIKPVIKTNGTPLDVAATLVREVKQSLPNNLQIDAKNLLDFMIKEIVSYCRETSAKSLSLNFSFEKM